MTGFNKIFLDIDGVILPFGAYTIEELPDIYQRPFDYLQLLVDRTPKNIVDNLKKLAEERDANFVLISTWRNLFSEDFLKAYFKAIDLDPEQWFDSYWIAVDRSAIERFGARRGKSEDIQHWLWRNEYLGEWWMIDDEAHMYVDEPHAIVTDPLKGFVFVNNENTPSNS